MGQLARLAASLPGFVRHPLTRADAIAAIRARLADRPARFLSVAETHVYGNSASPYRALLTWAGCEYGDLQQSVRRDGVESTLERLAEAGVRVTLAEFKARVPIVRRGLLLEPRESDFDNPFVARTGLAATTGGSRSSGSRVTYDWALMNEQAANERVLNEMHGVLTAPFALWLPALPAIAGVNSVLMNLRFGRTARKWFSQSDMNAGSLFSRHRLAMEYILACCRLLGTPLPRPEFTDFERCDCVAEWMARTCGTEAPPLLRTYPSSAVRLAQTVRARGLDVSGSVILCGGEPLTENRRSFIEATGAKVFPRYSATEAGFIGAACPNRTCADDMHVYVDRMAVIARADALLFSALSPHTGKVIFNTDLGDTGTLSAQRCDCTFGELGMQVRLANVRSREKLTGEGMAVLASDLDQIVGALVAKLGGTPDDYQLREADNADGIARLTVTIHPRLANLDPEQFRAAILSGLSRAHRAGAFSSRIWMHSGFLEVVRAEPQLSSRGKHRSMIPAAP